LEVFATMSERMRLADVAAHARRVESLGYDGLFVPDAVHDGLLVAQAALAATERIRVTTSVLVVFPRSPMVVAHAAWDLQDLSGGRFELGMGSQVRGNIVGRYSTPWTPPIPRMREYVQSLRAIFARWQHGEKLAFEGESYRFTRMQPFFDPGPLDPGPPPLLMGGVGPRMTALAGEVADGLMTHPTNSSARYLREVVVPRIADGAAASGRAPGDCRLMAAGFVATGVDDAAVAAQREWARELLTFLYSTPSYWPSLDLFGYREVGEALHAKTREGDWAGMKGLVTDTMLDAFVPSAPYTEIAQRLLEDYAGVASRITFPVPDDASLDGEARAVIARLRAGAS
jgi:probable F420-dependent oxidoreductase